MAAGKRETGAKRKTGARRAAEPLAWLGHWRRARRWLWRGLLGLAAFAVAMVALYSVVNPPTTPYILSEGWRLGHVDHQWVPMDKIAPAMARSAVAGEDANFCEHWGFDLAAIRAAAATGGERGGSTITQQVVKNVFLWQGHSYLRKAIEALLTPVVEMFWSKRRILEVYLNVAEFDKGAFGVAAGAAHYFHEEPGALTPRQAALMAAILPDPQGRNAAKPTAFVRRRAAAIIDGADTIRVGWAGKVLRALKLPARHGIEGEPVNRWVL